MKLTSVQEAAFNAAGEAMIDLGIKITLSYLGTGPAFMSPDDPRIFAFGNHPHFPHRAIYGDHSLTAAEAVQSLCDKHTLLLEAPPPLTGAQLVEAIERIEGVPAEALALIKLLPVT